MSTTKQNISGIFNLVEPHRTTNIKLINKIFENIINHPTNKRFQDLNYEKISKKLHKSCIDLLLNVGFVVTSNNSRLKFKEKYLERLRDAHKLLQDSIKTDASINCDHRSPRITEHNKIFNCICGKDLVKIIDRSTIYKSIVCDNIHCGKTVDPNCIVWHCNDRDSHPDGFDLCFDCINDNKYYPDGIMMLNQLIDFGFGLPEKTLADALEMSNYDINIAVDCLMNVMNNERSQDEDSVTEVETKVDIECDLFCCVHLKRIRNSLKQHKICVSMIDTDNEENNHVYDETNSYDDRTLLNDFNHLLFSHHNQFEEIYNIITKDSAECLLTDCIMLRRNNRDRSNVQENSPTSIYSSEEPAIIVRQQILDKIHSYYFHSFDTCYKINKKEKQMIASQCRDTDHCSAEVKLLSGIINAKRYKTDNRLQRFNTQEHKLHNGVNDEKTQQSENRIYSYGFRYYYWDFYKNSLDADDKILSMKNVYFGSVYPQVGNAGYTIGEWYIDSTFKNLKEELLQKIDAVVWQSVMSKANLHCQTDYARTIECDGLDREEVFGIKPGTLITREHVAAIQCYCNFDELSAKFSGTYRKLNATETNESLKKRHSNYAHLGRLLRECMECFGTNMKGVDYMKWKLYHGINQNIQFRSVCPYIKGPFSTTKSMA
eukprot:13073_1